MIFPAFGLALEKQVTSIEELADSYGKWMGILSNHVVNASSDFSGQDGSSRSISTPEDRELLLALRGKADLLVVDAKTARTEKYKMPSSGAALAIFSATGDFSGIPAVEDAIGNCYLFSPETAKSIGNCEYEPILDLENPLLGLSDWAQKRGLLAVLLEAGPTLTKIAFLNGLVGQSALTIAVEDLDVESIANRHPFDPLAKLVSVANAPGASFTYWNH
jgi:hypothetical protein